MLAAMRVAILLCAASILPATAATNVVKIAVIPLSDPNGWAEFQKYINGRLRGSCQIEFVARDPESALFDLMHPDEKDTMHAIQGAMLSPFRYVVADLWIPNLTLVARMRRVGVIESIQREQYQPLDSYHSIILVGVETSVRWPPDTDSVNVSISDYRSTSEFVFPFAYFSDAGLRSKVNPIARSSSVKTPADAWQIPDSPHRLSPEAIATYQHDTDADYQNQFDQVKELRASVPVISVGDHKLNGYFPTKADRDKFYRELFRSTDIPFDALVIRRDAVSETAMKAIRRAFLSTRDMSDDERNLCFKWIAEPAEADGKFWKRQPDIHDFVESQDEDYDVVRAAAAKAFGGCVVNIAISRRVHRDPKELLYFRNWMKNVLRQTVRSQPIYVDVQPRESDFNVLLDELEDGRLHAAELNAVFAARAIGRRTGALIGKAIFDNIDSYHFVMLAANLPTDAARIDKHLRFAYTSKDSSSGYQYPFAMLKQRGLNPAERSRIEGHNAAGVVKLLLNKIENRTDRFADYGFLASFEWDEIKKQWSGHDLKKIEPVALDEQYCAIPNAYLVFSRVSASGVDNLGAPSARPEPKSPFVRSSMSPPELGASVVASVKAKLYRDNVDRGFGGYEPVPAADLGQLQEFYDQYGNNPLRAGLLMLITLVVFLSAGLGFSFKRRGRAPQTELSIQSLSDVLKGVSPTDRNAQQAVTLAVKQLSVLRNATDLFTKIFGQSELVELQTNLESSLLGLLTFHNTKRDSVADGRYSEALAKLQTATAKADQQLREVKKTFSDWDQPRQQQMAGSISAINSVIEIAGRVMALVK